VFEVSDLFEGAMKEPGEPEMITVRAAFATVSAIIAGEGSAATHALVHEGKVRRRK
jgi:hypothetical protein